MYNFVEACASCIACQFVPPKMYLKMFCSKNIISVLCVSLLDRCQVSKCSALKCLCPDVRITNIIDFSFMFRLLLRSAEKRNTSVFLERFRKMNSCSASNFSTATIVCTELLYNCPSTATTPSMPERYPISALPCTNRLNSKCTTVVSTFMGSFRTLMNEAMLATAVPRTK